MDGEYDAALVKNTWLLATFGEMGSARASMRKIEKPPQKWRLNFQCTPLSRKKSLRFFGETVLLEIFPSILTFPVYR
jgi:hypothetical protein